MARKKGKKKNLFRTCMRTEMRAGLKKQGFKVKR